MLVSFIKYNIQFGFDQAITTNKAYSRITSRPPKS